MNFKCSIEITHFLACLLSTTLPCSSKKCDLCTFAAVDLLCQTRMYIKVLVTFTLYSLQLCSKTKQGPVFEKKQIVFILTTTFDLNFLTCT